MNSIDEQAALAAEAWRRASGNGEVPAGAPPQGYVGANAGVIAADTWSSGGQMPGVMTPDLQGPEQPLSGSSVTPVDENFGEGNFNVADIVRNHSGSR
jgi:hypothetical protein